MSAYATNMQLLTTDANGDLGSINIHENLVHKVTLKENGESTPQFVGATASSTFAGVHGNFEDTYFPHTSANGLKINRIGGDTRVNGKLYAPKANFEQLETQKTTTGEFCMGQHCISLTELDQLKKSVKYVVGSDIWSTARGHYLEEGDNSVLASATGSTTHGLGFSAYTEEGCPQGYSPVVGSRADCEEAFQLLQQHTYPKADDHLSGIYDGSDDRTYGNEKRPYGCILDDDSRNFHFNTTNSDKWKSEANHNKGWKRICKLDGT